MEPILISVGLGNAELQGGQPISSPFFSGSRRVQPPTIRWFQNSFPLSLRFSSRFLISSAKRSRFRGQGDRLRSTYWHSGWLHRTNSSLLNLGLREGLFFKEISTSSETTVQKKSFSIRFANGFLLPFKVDCKFYSPTLATISTTLPNAAKPWFTFGPGLRSECCLINMDTIGLHTYGVFTLGNQNFWRACRPLTGQTKKASHANRCPGRPRGGTF